MRRSVFTTRLARRTRGRSPAARWSASGRSATLVVLGLVCASAQAGCGGTATSARGPAPGAAKQHSAKLSPTFTVNVELAPVSGKVLVEQPGTRLVALTAAELVALGSVIDTRAGVVRLAAAYPAPGQGAVGEFQEGIFQVEQERTNAGLVDLRIQNAISAATCGDPHRGKVTTRLSARQLGLLLGSGTGRFRTDGQFSAATVRGTKWGVRNRCDGTLTIVRQGIVAVTDFVTHKTIVLHTGQQFLARAP
jgi:hypothetical protein